MKNYNNEQNYNYYQVQKMETFEALKPKCHVWAVFHLYSDWKNVALNSNNKYISKKLSSK